MAILVLIICKSVDLYSHVLKESNARRLRVPVDQKPLRLPKARISQRLTFTRKSFQRCKKAFRVPEYGRFSGMDLPVTEVCNISDAEIPRHWKLR
ncbi:hypothetical protein J6590_018284 [Homalodisca vitripennis]|nr:hypothetical protein J6590_018284 [Homalodisca vitripennis]